MTRDETINFLTPLLHRKMRANGICQPFTTITLEEVAHSMAETVVNELPNLNLDPQFAYASAELRRPKPPDDGSL